MELRLIKKNKLIIENTYISLLSLIPNISMIQFLKESLNVKLHNYKIKEPHVALKYGIGLYLRFSCVN